MEFEPVKHRTKKIFNIILCVNNPTHFIYYTHVLFQCTGTSGNSVGADGAACTSQGTPKSLRVSYIPCPVTYALLSLTILHAI